MSGINTRRCSSGVKRCGCGCPAFATVTFFDVIRCFGCNPGQLTPFLCGPGSASVSGSGLFSGTWTVPSVGACIYTLLTPYTTNVFNYHPPGATCSGSPWCSTTHLYIDLRKYLVAGVLKWVLNVLLQNAACPSPFHSLKGDVFQSNPLLLAGDRGEEEVNNNQICDFCWDEGEVPTVGSGPSRIFKQGRALIVL